MELIIVKNGHVYARATDDNATETDVFALNLVNDMPEYPAEPAGTGKEWSLDYVDGILTWIKVDRPLTQEERLEKVEEEIAETKYAWKVGEAVKVGDRRYYIDKWYTCIQAHVTQADWTPDITPALWEAE